MQKKPLVIIFIIVLISIITFLLYFFIGRSESHVRNKVKNGEQSMMEILKNNPDIIDFSEKELYSYDDEILITYKNLKIEFFKKGNVEKIERELEEKLTSLFERLNCEKISLRKERFGKVLEIFLGDVKIDKDNVYNHWITYSENKGEDLGDEILPNWYYKTLFFT